MNGRKWCAVMLAGGQSRRMGTSKALLKEQGALLTGRIVRQLRQVFGSVVTVARSEDIPLLRAAFGNESAIIRDDERFPGQGPLAGIFSAMKETRARFFYVTACDMPNVPPVYLSGLKQWTERHEGTGWQAAVPVLGGRLQPLAAVYRSVPDMIARLLTGDKLRMQDLLDCLAVEKLAEATWKAWTDIPNPFLNLNTPQDWLQWTKEGSEMNRLEPGYRIKVDEAIARLMAHAWRMPAQEAALENALGRRLAGPIHTTSPVPPFDRAPLDGFAFRSGDTSGTLPVHLRICGTAAAGRPYAGEIKPGEASRIMTGAPFPQGADCMLPFEAVRTFRKRNEAYVQIIRGAKPGLNMARKGEEIGKGETVIKTGKRIGPGDLAVLAAFGYVKVKVYRKPVVGILTTGSELVEADREPAFGQIRNSNAYMLMGQIAQAEGISRYYGIADDNKTRIFDRITEALRECDVLLTTGGASVGDYDYIPEILKELGAELLFDRVAMRPGSVTTAARIGERFVFGLSGNPSACFVGFELFVRPLLLHAAGSESPHLPRVRARLSADIRKANPFTRFIRGTALLKDGRLLVRPLGLDKSGTLTSLSGANALLIAPGGTAGLAAGSEIDVLLLRQPEAEDSVNA